MKPIKVAILWHMHQPNYQKPNSNELVLPWVRLHALKDYLDMPLLASNYDNLQVTFNLVPSLLDQLQLYIDGGTDRHLELSRLKADELSDELRREILNTFFLSHPQHMIEPYKRYHELYNKLRNNAEDPILPTLFSSEEIRDLQVWSNLTWVDPMFRNEEPVKSLFDKKRHFTEEEKHSLLDWQITLIARVVPTYRELFDAKKIDISFTPYYHPILPLLCDTDIAQEALPSITLPKRRFRHPEDARQQIRMSMDKYEELFGQPMQGMWPSEGSVSEEVADICLDLGIKWIATDEEILYQSLAKSQLDSNGNPLHTIYEYGRGLKLFFRDHRLSDQIGFVYSGWDAERAVDDFLTQIKKIGSLFEHDGERVVIPVILDGENAWEYFPNDGYDFLSELYARLSTDPDIETITMTDAANKIQPRPLPRLFAGSWINHNFRIWIGHPEDNLAWDLLSMTREALVQYGQQADADPKVVKKAWKQIYIAEGSDWCWWYGDEHRGANNEQFDSIFRGHLEAVYHLIGKTPPIDLLTPIYQREVKASIIQPDDIVTPTIDGKVTHFYEWAGAGCFSCVESGGAMHRAEQLVEKIYFAYDHVNIYIRLDFVDKKMIQSTADRKIQLDCYGDERCEIVVPVSQTKHEVSKDTCWQYTLQDILELAVKRSCIWKEGFGKFGLQVAIYEKDAEIEKWPEKEPLTFIVYEKYKEKFWPS